MRRLIIGFALVAIVIAKPELYREKEDFQYSRSSSDEGSKSGYYDAQRGNMGGNYEKAHNMDNLAQHQMGGLIKQVNGELGDGSNTRTGSVYTAAKSRGMYGSGHYDLSNLEGRNFQEGATYGDSHYSANKGYEAHSSSQNNARYSSKQSQNTDYRGYQAGSSQQAQNLHETGQREYGAQSGYDSRYGYQDSNIHQLSQTNQIDAHNYDANSNSRVISTVPVKIIIRPGQKIAIPVASQTTGSHLASYYDRNVENSDAEVLTTDGQQISFTPNNNAKHYESSYKYHKEWEKHDTSPEIPTISHIPVKNSEFYDDSQSQYASHSNDNNYRKQSEHNAASSQSRYQSDFDAQQQHHSSSSNSNSNAFSQSRHISDSNSHLANLAGAADSKPKSYQSSYSYHKSWERQGDPYVIQPAANGENAGQKSQRLSEGTNSQAEYSSHGYNSQYATKSHQNYGSSNCIVECEPIGHTRFPRSYNSEQAQFEQQSQNQKWDDYNDGGQQAQSTWEQTEYAQQSQNKLDNLEDFGQQSQATWSQPQLNQQTQNQIDNLEDLGQQSEKLEDFGQQSQSSWDKSDFGQQTQNKQDNLADLGQQSQTTWGQAEEFQQTQNKWDQLENLGQQHLEDDGQQYQSYWGQAEAGQETQNKWDNFQNVGQQTQNQWDVGQTMDQQNQNNLKFETTQKNHHETLPIWGNLEKKELGDANNLESQERNEEISSHFSQTGGKQETQTSNDQNYSFWETTNKNDGLVTQVKEIEEQPLGSLWDKIDNLDGDFATQDNFGKNEDHSLHSSSENWYQEHSLNNTIVFFHQGDQNYDGINIPKLNNEIFFKDIENTTNNINISSTTTSSEKENNNYNFRPIDIGRGDIGPNDLTIDSMKFENTDNIDAKSNNTNDKETSDEIINTTYKQTLEQNYGGKLNSTAINKPEEIYKDLKEERSISNQETKEKDLHIHSIIPTTDFEQQNTDHQSSVDFEQNNMNQQSLVDFEQQNIDQQSLVGFEHQNMHQQLPLNFKQHNMVQQSLKDFKLNTHHQSSVNLNQQNMDQQSLVDFEQHNKDQQSVSNFEQQNMDQQSLADFEQQNMDQQSLVNFEQQNIDQQSPVEFEQQNMDQQSLADFEQQNMDQQSFVNFKQQNTDQKYLADFEKQNTNQQSPLDFEQQNMDQQSLADFGQQNIDQQSLVNFEQQNVDQQSPVNFKQQNTDEQAEQNLKHFSDFEQQQESLNNFNENFDTTLPFEIYSQEEVQIKKEISHDSQKYVKPVDRKESKQFQTEDLNVTSILEPATEKPGFWKSVGNKFVSAKDKVASWFGT